VHETPKNSDSSISAARNMAKQQGKGDYLSRYSWKRSTALQQQVKNECKEGWLKNKAENME